MNNYKTTGHITDDVESSTNSSMINLNITNSSNPRSSIKLGDSKSNTITSKRIKKEKNTFI